MQEFFSNIFSDIGLNDVIDVLIVAVVIYKILSFVRNTRAEQLLKGLLILLVAAFLSGQFNLYALHWALNTALTLGVVAIVVVFQPELRQGLEYVGRGRLVKSGRQHDSKAAAKRTVSQLVRAVTSCAETKTGALIILEGQTSLADYVSNATKLDAEISAELLCNIFYEGSPLHDGAAIVSKDRVLAAGCVLPLSTSRDISKELGTRHRAGIGITEHTDAVSLIVSEETGIVSVAYNGKLTRFLDSRAVEKRLLSIYLDPKNLKERTSFFARFRPGRRDDDKDENDGMFTGTDAVSGGNVFSRSSDIRKAPRGVKITEEEEEDVQK